MAAIRPTDTTPDAQAVHDEILRRIGPAERVAIAFRLGTATRALTMAGIRRRHPDYSDRDVRQALARVLLGDDLVRKVWPEWPLVEP